MPKPLIIVPQLQLIVPWQVAEHFSPLKPLIFFVVFFIEVSIKSFISLVMHLEQQLSTWMGTDLALKCMWFRPLLAVAAACS